VALCQEFPSFLTTSAYARYLHEVHDRGSSEQAYRRELAVTAA